jgi:alpha 1,3-glucosidase
MVKLENFKTCDQSGFCKRNRAHADSAVNYGPSWTSPYKIIPDSIRLERGQLGATILKKISSKGETVRLPLSVIFLKSGTARVVVDEDKRAKGDIQLRHDSKAQKQRYNEVADWAVVGRRDLAEDVAFSKTKEAGFTSVLYGPDSAYEVKIRHEPFGIEFRRNGETHVKFNDRGFLNMEHWRPKAEKLKVEGEESAGEAEVGDDDEATWWDESFGGNTDTKPRGPESVGLDISFPGYEHVFGIPEHAGPMALKETRGGDGNYDSPYRMYNADVFEYIIDSPMTLYGSIPFMQAHRKNSTVGVFWLNAAETWVDIVKTKGSTNPLSLGVRGKVDTKTHWFSESGLLDVYVFLGPGPEDVTKAYGELTGYTQLPQQFAIAYHQCRWNYVTDEDVKDVDRKFDKAKIPYDVIWLDIEYTDEKKYFTWGPLTFPNPIGMQKQLDKRDRKLVAIIDPHIKNEGNYPIVDEMKSKNLAVRNKDGAVYEGWCWPGSSHWVDCFDPAAISWWISLFKYTAWQGTTSSLFIWNDMNEPSVFNGPETTMPKDNLHHGNWEHRDVHNLNGMTFHQATYEAMLSRDKKGIEVRRPFVLTRSFFAGSQRFGAMWTGDNQASWPHLAASIPMILNNGISGFPFAGADVGGFFGNPSKELLTRWYQAGAFYPFFRGHAHIDTRRREPYLAGDPYQGIITAALRLRYSLLPAWYTAFHEASVNGTPIVRPHYFVHPSDEKGFTLDDQFYIGSTGLLAKPIVAESAESVEIYIPADGETYYDYFDFTEIKGESSYTTLPAPLSKIPLLMQGGNIFPRRDRARRSSGLMKWDPFTLVVVLGADGNAKGSLYLDDGETFEYQEGAFIHRSFRFDGLTNKLFSEDLAPSTSTSTSKTPKTRSRTAAAPKTEAYKKSIKKVRVEKVILVGVPLTWASKKKVTVRLHDEDGVSGLSGGGGGAGGGGSGGGKEKKVRFDYHPAEGGKAAWAVVRDPAVAIARGWSISF